MLSRVLAWNFASLQHLKTSNILVDNYCHKSKQADAQQHYCHNHHQRPKARVFKLVSLDMLQNSPMLDYCGQKADEFLKQ